MNPTKIEILSQEIDRAGETPSYYRVLVDRKHFKYIEIDPGTYDVDDLCFPPYLLEKLPPFPSGDWNCARISRSKNDPAPIFQEFSKRTLPSIENLWYPKSYDYLSLVLGDGLMSNVYKVSSPDFDKPVIAKFARFYWQVQYYVAETQAYSWIEGHQIGPKFLGFLTEEDRVVGFLMEAIEGRHAEIGDLSACEDAVRCLHALGIIHGDLNKHNFLVTERGAVLIDFETAKRSEDVEAMEKEILGLEASLLDESGIGGTMMVEEGEDSD